MPASVLASAGSRVVCVTGMHRSGTSLAARAVNLLGVFFGSPSSLMPPGSDNPAGYWENRAVKELDDELLAQLGGTWDVPPVLARGWELAPSLDQLRHRAANILERDLELAAARGLVGWKDPRVSVLLPFWRTVVPVDATVLVIRDPREVAASLQARNQMPVAEAALLWLRYVLAVAADAPDHVLVRHQDLTDDLPGALATLAAGLGLPAPDARTLEAVNQHVDPSLRHHTETPGPLEQEHPVLQLALAVWNDGEVAVAALPEALTASLAQGWLGSPGNREAESLARAEAVDLRERLRKRNRQLRALSGPGADGIEPSP